MEDDKSPMRRRIVTGMGILLAGGTMLFLVWLTSSNQVDQNEEITTAENSVVDIGSSSSSSLQGSATVSEGIQGQQESRTLQGSSSPQGPPEPQDLQNSDGSFQATD